MKSFFKKFKLTKSRCLEAAFITGLAVFFFLLLAGTVPEKALMVSALLGSYVFLLFFTANARDPYRLIVLFLFTIIYIAIAILSIFLNSWINITLAVIGLLVVLLNKEIIQAKEVLEPPPSSNKDEFMKDLFTTGH